MPNTSTRRAETRSIGIEAPASADRLVDSGEGETRFTVRVSREQGTVDFVLTDDPQRASYSRVVPNLLGSQYIFTLFFPDGTDQATVAWRMAVIEAELATVRALCEG